MAHFGSVPFLISPSHAFSHPDTCPPLLCCVLCVRIRAEGAAVLVLEEMDHARDRGANILAEVGGWGGYGPARARGRGCMVLSEGPRAAARCSRPCCLLVAGWRRQTQPFAHDLKTPPPKKPGSSGPGLRGSSQPNLGRSFFRKALKLRLRSYCRPPSQPRKHRRRWGQPPRCLGFFSNFFRFFSHSFATMYS